MRANINDHDDHGELERDELCWHCCGTGEIDGEECWTCHGGGFAPDDDEMECL